MMQSSGESFNQEQMIRNNSLGTSNNIEGDRIPILVFILFFFQEEEVRLIAELY